MLFVFFSFQGNRNHFAQKFQKVEFDVNIKEELLEPGDDFARLMLVADDRQQDVVENLPFSAAPVTGLGRLLRTPVS